MASQSIFKAAGLYTAANNLSAVPQGAMSTANNVVIRSKDVVEPRRGQGYVSYSPSLNPEEIFFFNDTLLVHTGSTLERDTGAAFSAYSSTYVAPDTGLMRMKFAEAQQSLYFTTANGVYTLDSVSGTPKLAGLYRPPDTTGSALSASTPAWLADDYQCAYRYTILYLDANGRLIESEPSGRLIVKNEAGGSRSTQITIPTGSSLNHLSTFYIRLYRSRQVPITVSPDDRMYLAYESSASQVSGATVTLNDFTAEEALSQPAYFSVEADPAGVKNANRMPPFCKDITSFAGRLWFANTRRDHFMEIQVLGGSSYLNGAVIAIGSTSMTGSNVNSNTGTTLRFDSTGTVQKTAENIVAMYNDWTRGGGIQAYCVAGADEFEGRIIFEKLGSKANSGTAFTFAKLAASTVDFQPTPTTLLTTTATGVTRASNVVTVETTAAHGFAPGDFIMMVAGAYNAVAADAHTYDTDFTTGLKLVATTPTSTTFTYAEAGVNKTIVGRYGCYKRETTNQQYISSNDAAPHRLYYSKYDLPEAVPLLNYLDIGAKNKAILRIVPLRNSLFVFKQDGLFVVRDAAVPTWRELDPTVRLMSPDSVVAVNGQIVAFTDQGIVSITESGVGQILSWPIETDILSLLGTPLAVTKQYSWGCAYDADRSYLIGLPSDENDFNATQIYCYNFITQAWTRWPIERSCARVNTSTGILYLGHVDEARVWKERKAYDASDATDQALSVTISSSSGTSVTLSSASGVGVGDVLNQSSTYGVVTEVNSNTLTLATTESWSNGAATVYKAIPTEVVYQVLTSEAPAKLKQFSSATYHFKNLNCVTRPSGVTYTELNTTPVFPAIDTATTGLHNRRILIPTAHQRGAYLNVGFKSTEARAQWKLNGVTLELEMNGERSDR